MRMCLVEVLGASAFGYLFSTGVCTGHPFIVCMQCNQWTKTRTWPMRRRCVSSGNQISGWWLCVFSSDPLAVLDAMIIDAAVHAVEPNLIKL